MRRETHTVRDFHRRIATVRHCATLAILHIAPAVCAGLVFAAKSSAQPAETATRVLAFVVPGLRADDLPRAELPALRRLLREGAGGWMVCRAARTARPRPDGDSKEALLLTLNAGARAAFPPHAETDPLTPHDLLVPPPIDHPARSGLLGDVVRKAGAGTAALGSIGSGRTDARSLLIAMDARGEVDHIAAAIRPDAGAPYGIRADVPALLAEMDDLPLRVRFVSLLFGDLDRADRYAPLCLSQAAASHRARALQDLNRLLSALLERGRRTPFVLLVLSPGPAASVGERTDRIAPFLMWGAGIARGSVRSASTRRSCLVVNTDFLPTVLSLLRLPTPPQLAGRPIMPTPGEAQTPEALRARHDALVRTARLQAVLGGLPSVQLLLTLFGFACLRAPRLRVCAAPCGVLIVALPLGMLVLPPFAPQSIAGAAASLAIWAAAGVAFALAASRNPGRQTLLFQGICAALFTVIFFDLLTGSHLLARAWMSYSVMEGARFYGVGNEYMGATIGAGLVMLAPIMTWRKRALPGGALLEAALACSMTLVLSAPGFGAKVGALPSAGGAFGALLLAACRDRAGRRGRLLLLLLGAAAFALLALSDLRHAPGTQTHLARALLGAGGDSIAGIVRRKLEMEGYLLLHSPWTLTLLAAAAALVAAKALQPEAKDLEAGEARCVSDERIVREAALRQGLLAGALLSLLCNDAGVLAAALILLYGWAWALLQSASRPDRAAGRP